ncbi:MAG: CPBP family intramembrane glutamic endopeptidase [Infirmifilum sp.]
MDARREKLIDFVLLVLPWLLFLLPFQLLRARLIEAMVFVSLSLAVLVILTGRASLHLKGKLWPLSSALGALVLYAIFLAGGVFAKATGMWGQVMAVYSAAGPSVVQLIGVPVIGLAEEAYWRGFVQRYFTEGLLGLPWWVSVAPYSLVHVVSGMPLLVLAAIPVGLVMGLICERNGVLASGISHAVWLYLVLYVFPVSSILSP